LVARERRDRKADNPAVVWARYSEIAFIIPAAVVVGLLLGKLLDYWLKTHWLFLGGIIFGAVVGFVQMIRMVTRGKE
jgi:F0F1-type ATP synthase assembly protein I